MEEEKKQHIENIDNKIKKQTKERTSSMSSDIEEVENKSTDNSSIEQSKLYKELKQYRLERSKADGIKPYFIYNNVQLEEIANKKPKTIDELKSIKGFGDVKCEKYGEGIKFLTTIHYLCNLKILFNSIMKDCVLMIFKPRIFISSILSENLNIRF